MSALSSFYGPSLTLDTQRPPLLGRRRFSSACKIAQITFMGYPPKIQPQASALRGERRRSQAPNSIKTDNLVSLDALDEEAGCILLALSNHKYENVESLPKTMASSDAASSSSSASDSGSPSKSSPSDGNSMSINNLLGSSDGDAAGLASPVPNTQGGPVEDPIVQSSTKELAHVSKAERPPPFAPFDPESDPIMILAAAAAAVNDEDRKRQSQDESGASEPPRQKRKWQAYYGYSSSSSSSNNNNNNGVNDEQPDMHPEKRHRYQQPASSLLQDSTWHEKVPATQAEEGLKFSSHYMSMKENPKIKRNAMHAYITYMIYTNMSHENSASATDSSKVATQSAKIARTDSPLPSSSHHYGPPPPPPSTLSRPNDEVPDARSSSDKADLSAAARVPLERAAAYSTSSPSSYTGLQNFADYNSHRNNSSSSWYPPSSYQQQQQHQQAPPPPVTHSPRALALSSSAIVDRPLTAFLWDDKKSERKDSSLALPPFNAPPPPPPSLAPQQQTTPATSPQL